MQACVDTIKMNAVHCLSSIIIVDAIVKCNELIDKHIYK